MKDSKGEGFHGKIAYQIRVVASDINISERPQLAGLVNVTVARKPAKYKLVKSAEKKGSAGSL
jgi:hypothetical protein